MLEPTRGSSLFLSRTCSALPLSSIASPLSALAPAPSPSTPSPCHATTVAKRRRTSPHAHIDWSRSASVAACRAHRPASPFPPWPHHYRTRTTTSPPARSTAVLPTSHSHAVVPARATVVLCACGQATASCPGQAGPSWGHAVSADAEAPALTSHRATTCCLASARQPPPSSCGCPCAHMAGASPAPPGHVVAILGCGRSR